MSARRDNDFERLLEAFLKQSGAAERVDEFLGEELDRDAAEVELSPELRNHAVAAVSRGMFDANVARARANTVGALGTFGTALRRIREAAGCSLEDMAERARVAVEYWQRLEDQAISPNSLDIQSLASIVEAVQLTSSDLRATLRRSESVRALPGGQASFRADDLDEAGSTAAYEDLVAAVADDTADSSDGAADEVATIVERVQAELRRRGRADLL